MKSIKMIVASIVFFFVTPVTLVTAQGTYTQIDPPGATFTRCQGIDSVGDIVGFSVDTSSNVHGFLLSGGTYSMIDYPGAEFGTALYGINDLGQIVGSADINADTTIGFIFDSQSQTFTDIRYPGASTTVATAINDAGKIAGYFSANSPATGFALVGSTFVEIKTRNSFETIPGGITASGVVVGNGLANNETTIVNFAFVNGALKPLKVHASIPIVNGIDPMGRTLVGNYASNTGSAGFTYQNGTITTLEFPGGSVATVATAINDTGDVVGWFNDSSFNTHGFMWTP